MLQKVVILNKAICQTKIYNTVYYETQYSVTCAYFIRPVMAKMAVEQ